MEKPKILVVGSMNMDLFVEGANSIPGFGESIMCCLLYTSEPVEAELEYDRCDSTGG